MGFESVRDAYSSRSQQYLALFDDGWVDDDGDTALVRRHLTGLTGPVLDLGCGPGHWTADLHARGADVTGVDLVPEFIAHARATHPGPAFRLGSMTELDVPEHSVAGILSWYSTIHLPPPELDRVLGVFRRLLSASGVLVIGFFDSDDGVAAFDHKVTTAYRWPADVFAEHLATAGFTEIERVQHDLPERPDRKYAALAASVQDDARLLTSCNNVTAQDDQGRRPSAHLTRQRHRALVPGRSTERGSVSHARRSRGR